MLFVRRATRKNRRAAKKKTSICQQAVDRADGISSLTETKMLIAGTEKRGYSTTDVGVKDEVGTAVGMLNIQCAEEVA